MNCHLAITNAINVLLYHLRRSTKRSLTLFVLHKATSKLQSYYLSPEIVALNLKLDDVLYCINRTNVGQNRFQHYNLCAIFVVTLCTVLGYGAVHELYKGPLSCKICSLLCSFTSNILHEQQMYSSVTASSNGDLCGAALSSNKNVAHNLLIMQHCNSILELQFMPLRCAVIQSMERRYMQSVHFYQYNHKCDTKIAVLFSILLF